MDVQLSILRQLIFEKLDPEADSNLSSEEIPLMKKEIVSVGLRLFDRINAAIFSTVPENLLQRHLGQLQRECVFLKDVLYGYTEIKLGFMVIVDAITSILNKVMDYISGYNGEYFNQNNRLPESKKQELLSQLKQSGLVLSAKIKSRSIVGKLPELIAERLADLEEKNSISYQQMDYMKMMVAETTRLLSHGRSRNWEKKLAVKLIALNFNTPGFFNYCIGLIAKAVDEEKSVKKQVQLFSWYAKEIKKLVDEGSSRAYSRMRPGIVALIGIYIASELDYLSDHHEKQAKDTFRNRADHYTLRLKVNMPIGAFALHIQLFIAMELFPKEIRKNEINEFMADHFCTIGTDSFTANSFDKKRTELDEASYRIVDKHLVDMRTYLKTRFEGE